jgi:hypothetical protein
MKKLLRSLLPALLFLLLMGLQSAMGCSTALGTGHNTAKIQVNACHFHIDFNTADTCCDSAACHLNTAPLRHFGSPEYANQIKDLLPLILESRQQVPQPKTAPALQQHSIPPLMARQDPIISIVPRHALLFLRTTILLH